MLAHSMMEHDRFYRRIQAATLRRSSAPCRVNGDLGRLPVHYVHNPIYNSTYTINGLRRTSIEFAYVDEDAGLMIL